MLTRRLVASVCALALAVPAVASARSADNGTPVHRAGVVYGDTKYDLQNTQDLAPQGVTGDTKDDIVPAGNGVGAVLATRGPQPAHPVASSDDGTNGWRIAAVAEAGLLAAIALGSAAFVGRMRPRRGAAA